MNILGFIEGEIHSILEISFQFLSLLEDHNIAENKLFSTSPNWYNLSILNLLSYKTGDVPNQERNVV